LARQIRVTSAIAWAVDGHSGQPDRHARRLGAVDYENKTRTTKRGSTRTRSATSSSIAYCAHTPAWTTAPLRMSQERRRNVPPVTDWLKGEDPYQGSCSAACIRHRGR
jgi:hypothetical protein